MDEHHRRKELTAESLGAACLVSCVVALTAAISASGRTASTRTPLSEALTEEETRS